MWLWYLELYIAVLLAFLVGVGIGVLGVRLLVRRTDGFSLGLGSPDSPPDAPSSSGTSP